jgi:hypothetical protein
MHFEQGRDEVLGNEALEHESSHSRSASGLAGATLGVLLCNTVYYLSNRPGQGSGWGARG